MKMKSIVSQANWPKLLAVFNQIMFLPRIILVKPSHPGNIGAVARSMKVMGLSSLYLVSPKKFPDKEAFILASHAADILNKAVVVDSLVDALKDITYVYASSANPRDENIAIFNSREAMLNIVNTQNQQNHSTAIIFGPENHGLSHKDLLYAHALIQIPTGPDYRSLNLASAVQIIAYEYHMAVMGKVEKDKKHEELPEDAFANMAEIEGFYHHLEEILIDVEFLNPHKPRYLMQKLRRLFNRAHLDQFELNILRGFLKAIASKLK